VFAPSGELARTIELAPLFGTKHIRNVSDLVVVNGCAYMLTSSRDRPTDLALVRIDLDAGAFVQETTIRKAASIDVTFLIRLQQSGSALYVHGDCATVVYDVELNPVVSNLPRFESHLVAYDHDAGLIAVCMRSGVLRGRAARGFKPDEHFRYGYKGASFPNDDAFVMGPAGRWFALAIGRQLRIHDDAGQLVATASVPDHINLLKRATETDGRGDELVIFTRSGGWSVFLEAAG
jgi:hypothetical protein